MHKHPALKIVGKITWLITSLVAIFIGLIPFGYHTRFEEMVITNPNLVMWLQYLIGIAGVISLVMLVGCMLMGHRCCCDDRHRHGGKMTPPPFAS